MLFDRFFWPFGVLSCSSQETFLFINTMIDDENFRILLPLACLWAEEKESIILRDGVPLTTAQLEDAKTIGVTHPKKIRLLKVPVVPMPENEILFAAAVYYQLISPETRGLTLRYGIFIRADSWDVRELVFHELVHTSQYERLGSVEPFLQRYLRECIAFGYPNGSLEQEAINTTKALCI
ncbi:MAG: hypothetical protein ABSE62_06980 [Chthoniobacteraceae bacterium]|jgi:hypothetical protein